MSAEALTPQQLEDFRASVAALENARPDSDDYSLQWSNFAMRRLLATLDAALLFAASRTTTGTLDEAWKTAEAAGLPSELELAQAIHAVWHSWALPTLTCMTKHRTKAKRLAAALRGVPA